MQTIRPRRSVLFMPAANARMLEKARALACDVVVLDLEDSVSPDAKDAARAAACAAVRDYGAREVAIRINALDTPWGQGDLKAVEAAKPDAIVVPKVSTPADLPQSALPLWAMIETPSAILNLAAIAAAGPACLVMGANDLMKDMGASPLPDRRNLWAALSLTVIAARAHGLAVLDGTYNAIDDANGFAMACEQGKAFGFDGKSLIHPGQIETANRIFAPSVEECAEAKAILSAFALPENRGKGAIALEGRMVERLHAEAAERLLALAEAIRDA